MINLFFNSILLGLLISVFVGPVFFLLIEISIKHDYKRALQVSIGAFSSDIIYIVLSYLLVTGILNFSIEESLLKVIGGAIFALLGIIYLFKPSINRKIKTPRNFSANFFLKSFMMNSVNPSVLFFWIGVISYGKVIFRNNFNYLIYYIIIALITAFIMDLLKIYLSQLVKKLLQPSVLAKINLFTGLAFLIFGILLIINNYFDF